MATLITIVFCLDFTTMMGHYINEIRGIIMRIIQRAMKNQVDVRFGLVLFRSKFDTWNSFAYNFTNNPRIFEGRLNNAEPGGNCQNGYAAVGDGLKKALQMLQWPGNDQEFEEKIVVLFTSDVPNGITAPLVGADPWVISNQFLANNITLVIVGVSKTAMTFDDFYCALAKNTRGLFIPLINFESIFSNVITMISNEGDTAHQAFRHISLEEIEEDSSFKYALIRDRVNGMILECHTMADIKRLFFDYRF